MQVLRVGQREGIGAQSFTELAEAGPQHFGAPAGPVPLTQMDNGERDSLGDHLVGEAKLAIKLERPGMDRHRPRVLPGT